MSLGNAFHADRPACEKALWPNMVRKRGNTNCGKCRPETAERGQLVATERTVSNYALSNTA